MNRGQPKILVANESSVSGCTKGGAEISLSSRDLDNSRPLDVHRWSEHPEVHDLVDTLWERYFRDFETNTGKQGKRPKGHPKRQLRVLILDLYAAWKTDPDLSIGVPMTKSAYRSDSRYNALHISSVMIGLVHRAHDAALIGFSAGSEFAGRTSRIWPEQPLIEMFKRAKFGVLDIGPCTEKETIILSAGKGQWVEYADTPQIEAMREKMVAYNRLLHTTFIDIPTLDYPVITLPAASPNGKPTLVHIDQNDKFSRRIFYRESWDLGGRVHGGFWQRIPEDWRAKFWLNDLPVVEDDYSGIHIALLYGLEGAKLGSDPYALDLATSYDAATMRRWVKQLSLVAINAKTEKAAFQAFRQKQATGSPAKSFSNQQLAVILDAFKAKHAPIAQYLCSDEGVRLMAIDGRITARIIDRFTSEGVPVLTVFDSYLIDVFHAPDLRAAMYEAMDAEVPGASTNIERTGIGYDELLASSGDSVSELLALPKRTMNGVVPSEGYRYRHEEFRAWRASQPGWDKNAVLERARAGINW